MFPLQVGICYILPYNQIIKMNNQIFRIRMAWFRPRLVCVGSEQTHLWEFLRKTICSWMSPICPIWEVSLYVLAKVRLKHNWTIWWNTFAAMKSIKLPLHSDLQYPPMSPQLRQNEVHRILGNNQTISVDVAGCRLATRPIETRNKTDISIFWDIDHTNTFI